MTIAAWTTLWIALLWLSACAFGLVTLYIATGATRRWLGKDE